MLSGLFNMNCGSLQYTKYNQQIDSSRFQVDIPDESQLFRSLLFSVLYFSFFLSRALIESSPVDRLMDKNRLLSLFYENIFSPTLIISIFELSFIIGCEI